MSDRLRTIAILAQSPALASLLAVVLGGSAALRVRVFDNAVSLGAYARIAPVDLVVCDLDDRSVDAAATIALLRADPALAVPGFHALAIGRALAPSMRSALLAAGIDEVLLKPMSPRHLRQRMLARLREQRATPPPPRRARTPAPGTPLMRRRFSGNVVELFPGARQGALQP